jgi:2-oxoglutarate ferredoxin oxidoreductase subunit beta
VPAGYDPTDRAKVTQFLDQHRASNQIVTGLLYVDPNSIDIHEMHQTVETPLREIPYEELCPGSAALDKLQEEYR